MPCLSRNGNCEYLYKEIDCRRPVTRVRLGSYEVDALLDTGSAVNIVSEATFKRIDADSVKMQVPTLKLIDFNKQEIPVIAQAQVTVAVGETELSLPMFVHDQMDLPCLLGFEASVALGLIKVKPGVELRETTQDVAAVAVKLVESCRLLPDHAAWARVKIDGGWTANQLLTVQQDKTGSDEADTVVEDALLEPDVNGRARILLTNVSGKPVELKKSAVVGRVEAAEIVGLEAPSDSEMPVQEEKGREERQRKLRAQLDFSGVRMSEREVETLKEFVSRFDSVFAVDDAELGRTEMAQHVIDTQGSLPIYQRARREPFALRSEVVRMVKEMQDKGVVKPSSTPWSSPIVLVRKSSGGYRFCVDYRKLNGVTRKDGFPLPRIDDLIDRLGGSCIFSCLDAASGYWQVPVAPESRQKTAFITQFGLFEFNVMPFGLCNAPATFQRLMQTVLAGLEEFSEVYIDDIIVFSKNLDDHMKHLELVFDRVRRAGMKLKPEKCQLAQPETVYLGHVISGDGIKPDPKKTVAVQSFPVPQNVKALRSFHGLASYYRKFVEGFARITAPLRRLLKDGTKFEWSESCQSAFEKLQRRLTSAPVLVYPDFDRPFLVSTDASGQGLGAVLEQVEEDGYAHPVAYASRSLSPAETRYGISELEALAAVWALKKFRAYLLGHKTILFTDHAALKSLLDMKNPSGKLGRWGMAIQEISPEIHYRAGRVNGNAAALSRSPMEAEKGDTETITTAEDVMAVPVAAVDQRPCNTEKELQRLAVDRPEIAEEQRKDPHLAEIIRYIEEGILPEGEAQARRLALSRGRFDLIEGTLCYVEPKSPHRIRVAVPRQLRSLLMEETHSGRISGHFAEKALYAF